MKISDDQLLSLLQQRLEQNPALKRVIKARLGKKKRNAFLYGSPEAIQAFLKAKSWNDDDIQIILDNLDVIKKVNEILPTRSVIVFQSNDQED